MILMDSDWMIDLFNGNQRAVRYVASLGGEPLAISPVTIGEVYEGVLNPLGNPSQEEPRFLEWLERFVIMDLDLPTIRQFSALRGQLRRSGMLIGDNDLYIAATALRYDLELATRNRRHFARIPELRLRSVDDGTD